MLKNKLEPWLSLNKLMWKKIIDFKDKTWQVDKMFWFVHLCQFCLYHLHQTPQLYPVSNSFESFISHRVGGSLATFLNFLRLQLTCPIMLIVSQSSQASMYIRCVIQAFGCVKLVHFTVLSQNQGGYYNSLILQALEVPPRAGELDNGHKPPLVWLFIQAQVWWLIALYEEKLITFEYNIYFQKIQTIWTKQSFVKKRSLDTMVRSWRIRRILEGIFSDKTGLSFQRQANVMIWKTVSAAVSSTQQHRSHQLDKKIKL